VPIIGLPLLARQISERLLGWGIETAFVRAWIRRVNLTPGSPDPPGWPWAVAVRTLGSFRVEVQGAPLSFTKKAQRKPLELLQAIVAGGGAEVATGALCAELWGDSEADDAEAALRMALSRLRKLLGREAVVLRQGRLSLDPRSCWVDATALHRLSVEIERRPDPAHATRLFELYRGAFLGSEREQPWMVRPREKLLRRFVASVSALRDQLERQGRRDEAMALHRAAVHVDGGAENLLRMRTLA
jgi:DNA-binding SARP family transcriptional activator